MGGDDALGRGDGTRRPHWLKRPLKPVAEAYKLPEKPFGR